MKKILSLFLFLLSVLPAKAQDDVFGLQYGDQLSLGDNDPVSIVIKIIQLFLSFLGIVALIVVLMSGFRIMVAGGNVDAMSTAKKSLLNGIIGLVIIMSAYGLVKWILNTLSQATSQ